MTASDDTTHRLPSTLPFPCLLQLWPAIVAYKLRERAVRCPHSSPPTKPLHRLHRAENNCMDSLRQTCAVKSGAGCTSTREACRKNQLNSTVPNLGFFCARQGIYLGLHVLFCSDLKQTLPPSPSLPHPIRVKFYNTLSSSLGYLSRKAVFCAQICTRTRRQNWPISVQSCCELTFLLIGLNFRV